MFFWQNIVSWTAFQMINPCKYVHKCTQFFKIETTAETMRLCNVNSIVAPYHIYDIVGKPTNANWKKKNL